MLEISGGPFDQRAWRDSWVESFPEWRDASFGGELADGTRAAVSLLRRGRMVESTPSAYGTIVAGRQLGEMEVRSFLEAARSACGAGDLVARSVPLKPDPRTCHFGASVRGWTSVVYIEKGGTLTPRFTHKARHSMRKAAGAGAEVVATRNPEGFLPLYAAAAANHWMRYPDALVRSLARARVARFFDVRLGANCVASVMVVTSMNHWIAWLAAQDARGRSIDANYLAVGEMLAAAQRWAVPAVNLGISLGMPGVAHFKRQFDAVEVPLVEYRVASWTERARAGTLRLKRRGLRRIARLIGSGDRRRSSAGAEPSGYRAAGNSRLTRSRPARSAI
jgi:hypothetical protein